MTAQHTIAGREVFCPRIKEVSRTLKTVVKLLEQLSLIEEIFVMYLALYNRTSDCTCRKRGDLPSNIVERNAHIFQAKIVKRDHANKDQRKRHHLKHTCTCRDLMFQLLVFNRYFILSN
jgi:hypothetical protein